MEPSPSQRRFLGPVALFLAAAALWLAWPLKGPIAFALVFAYLLQPLQRRLSRVVRKPGLSALLLTLGLAVLVVAPFALAGGLVAQEVRSALEGADPEAVRSGLVSAAGGLGIPEERARSALDDAAKAVQSTAQERGATVALGAATLVVDFFLFLLLLYFLVLSWPRLRGFADALLPFEQARREKLYARAGERVKALVLGSVIIAAIQGTIGGLGWWLLGLPNPLLWGLVMFLLELVPLMGSFIVLLPAAIWRATEGDWVDVAGLLALNFVAVGLIDDWLRAALVGRWSHIEPALILVGIVGGISLMGLPGLLIGPLVLGMLPLMLRAWAGDERAFDREQEERGAGGRVRKWVGSLRRRARGFS